MYGKFHASAFTGSMRGAGPVIFSVWAYVVANTNQHSVIELNPDVIAFLIGCQTSDVEAALATLCAEDPKSRCKDNDGRRLVKEGEYQYFVPTHKRYRDMKNTDEKREYNRVKKQEERARKGDVKHDVKHVKHVNATEAEAEADSKAEAEAETSTAPPTPPAVASAPAKLGFADGAESRLLPTTPQARRIADIFHRKHTTPWGKKEVEAYKALGTVEKDDLEALEAYYAANWPPTRGVNYLRTDLATLLNNFAGEVGRAHAAKLAPAKTVAASRQWEEPRKTMKVITITAEDRAEMLREEAAAKLNR